MKRESTHPKQRLSAIRRAWLQTEEGRRVDRLARDANELEAMFNHTIFSLTLRMDEIGREAARQPASVVKDIRKQLAEMKKEVSLCRDIGQRLFDSRRINNQP